VLGILNDGREFSLWTSRHILANVIRVLTAPPPTAYGWKLSRAEEYVEILIEMAEAAGGGLVEPTETVADCSDHEDTGSWSAPRRAHPCSS
jgi:hypothetical protein